MSDSWRDITIPGVHTVTTNVDGNVWVRKVTVQDRSDGERVVFALDESGRTVKLWFRSMGHVLPSWVSQELND